MSELSFELTIRMLLLPLPLLAVVVRRPPQRLTILLQQGLSRRTQVELIVEALAVKEETADVRP